MRKRTLLFLVLALVAGGIATQLQLSGAGQHYSAIIQQAADAAGNLTGGRSGGGSASMAASTSVAADAVGLVAHIRFSSTRGVDLDLTPGLPALINGGQGCLEITQGSTTVESGCGDPGLSIVDPATQLALIDFVVPTNLGTCAVLVAEVGTGSPPLTAPSVGLDTGGPVPLPEVGLGNSRDATGLIGEVVCTSGNGGTMAPGFSGHISSDLNVGASGAPGGGPFVGLPLGSASGGGFIDIADAEQNRKGTFGFSFSGPVPQGGLSYHDHLGEVTVQSTAVTSLLVSVDGNTATATGLCKVNGVAGYQYTVTVTDGDPDTFSIHVIGPSVDYQASGNLGGGNITVSGT